MPLVERVTWSEETDVSLRAVLEAGTAGGGAFVAVLLRRDDLGGIWQCDIQHGGSADTEAYLLGTREDVRGGAERVLHDYARRWAEGAR